MTFYLVIKPHIFLEKLNYIVHILIILAVLLHKTKIIQKKPSYLPVVILISQYNLKPFQT